MAPDVQRSDLREWLKTTAPDSVFATQITRDIATCRKAEQFDGSNAEMKAASARENQCVRLATERLDSPRLLARRRAFVKSLCLLTEDVQWVDFDTELELMQGSMYEFTFLGCMAASYDEQLLLLRSAKSRDVTLVARRMADAGSSGGATSSLLDCRARALASGKLKQLAERFAAVLAGARALARDQCSESRELATALHDCEGELTAYFVHPYYERVE